MKTKIEITSRDDADRALKLMGEIEALISDAETRYNELIDKVKEEMVEECGPVKKTLKKWVRALEKWTTKNKAREFPEDSKTLELNFGKIFFKWTPWRIEFDVAEETVIERLRARKMESCIRVVASVNREALEAYDDEVLKKLGCRRERDDKFHYEVKKEEVK